MGYQNKTGKDFIDLKLVQNHLDSAEAFISERIGKIFRSEMEGSLRYLNYPSFDSPLEVLFWIWWDAVSRTSNHLWNYFDIEPQAEVVVSGELFRVDFLIKPIEKEIAALREWKPIAVEVDGHEFHERTPEQVAYRDRRDRLLQFAGWQVFHFSFKEFTANPKQCVSDVMAYARDQRNEVSRFVGRDPTPGCEPPSEEGR